MLIGTLGRQDGGWPSKINAGRCSIRNALTAIRHKSTPYWKSIIPQNEVAAVRFNRRMSKCMDCAAVKFRRIESRPLQMSDQFIYNVASPDNSRLLTVAISSLLGAISGGLMALATAGVVEKIKLWVGHRTARSRLWTALYREFVANYLLIEDTRDGVSSLGPLYICQKMLHTECYEEAQKQPLVFRAEETAGWFDVIYGPFPKWRELADVETNAETIRSDFTSWYNAARVDLRKSTPLKVGLKKYLSKIEYRKLKLNCPAT
jgi:hypothetical protein